MFERARRLWNGGDVKILGASGSGSMLNLEPPAPMKPPGSVTGWYTPDVKDRYFLQPTRDVTPEEMAMWIRLADTGETRFLHAFYEEIHSKDTHIRSEIGKQISLVKSARRDVLPTPKTLRKRSSKGAAEYATAHECVDYIESQVYAPRVRLARALAHLCKGRFFGIAALAVETIPGAGPKGRELLTGLIPVAHQRLRLIRGTQDYEVRVGDDEWIPLQFLQDVGAAIVIKFEEEVTSPARRGIFRAIVPHYIIRNTVPLSWGRFVELFGMPIRTAEVPADDLNLKAETEFAFREQGSAAFFTLPAGVKMQMMEAAKGTSPHEGLVLYSSKEISKVVNFSTQTTDIQKGAGSQSSSIVMFDVMVICAQDLSNEVAGVMMEQLFEGLIRRNISEEAAKDHTPELRLWVRGGENLKEFMDALKSGRDAGLKIGADWAYDQGGIQPPDEDDELLGDGQPAPQPGIFGQPPGAPGAAILPFAPPGARSPRPMPPGAGQPNDAQARQVAERIVLAYTGKLPLNPANELLATLESKAAEEAFRAGEELLAPYADLLKRAVDEKWPMPQLLSRVLHRFYGKPGATSAQLRDVIAATIADAALHGIEEARSART